MTSLLFVRQRSLRAGFDYTNLPSSVTPPPHLLPQYHPPDLSPPYLCIFCIYLELQQEELLQRSVMAFRRPDERRLGAGCQLRGPLQILLVLTERDNGTENKPTLVKVQKKNRSLLPSADMA